MEYWNECPLAAPDPIFGVQNAYLADPRENKVDLTVGAYRDDNGKSVVLKCVLEAQRRLIERNVDHEYLRTVGLEPFCVLVKKLMLGESGRYVDHAHVATVQALSGTGSLRMAAEFMQKYRRPVDSKIYIPNPTWGNHQRIFNDAGFDGRVDTYRYFDTTTGGVLFDALLEDIKNMPERSIVLLHACAHNPTGADPTHDQWRAIRDVCIQKNHTVLFDCAYQGFASGYPERDAFAMRLFVAAAQKPLGKDVEGEDITDKDRLGVHMDLIICQSFAKSLGLYGERVGSLSFVCANEEEAKRVRSQAAMITRGMHSNPPAWGARLATEVMGDEELHKLWNDEMIEMSGRISLMRKELVKALKEAGSTRDWSHIERQIGMFSYTLLTRDQCKRLQEEFGIYPLLSGRISMAGLNSHNVKYIAEAMHAVTKE